MTSQPDAPIVADASRPDEAELLVQTIFPVEEFDLPSQEPVDLGKENS